MSKVWSSVGRSTTEGSMFEQRSCARTLFCERCYPQHRVSVFSNLDAQSPSLQLVDEMVELLEGLVRDSKLPALAAVDDLHFQSQHIGKAGLQLDDIGVRNRFSARGFRFLVRTLFRFSNIERLSDHLPRARFRV